MVIYKFVTLFLSVSISEIVPQIILGKNDLTSYIHTPRLNNTRRGARVVESGGLENRCARKCTVGSNPTLSAT